MELTIEEKAKAYDESIERMRTQVAAGLINQDVSEYVFPELAESEDEKIKKEIIDFLKEGKNYFSPNSKKRQEWATWLEKQKESNQSKSDKWTDDDWNNIETIATHLDNLDNQAMATVLRNLRDKMFWKPTSAQLDSLFISKNIVRKEHFEKMSDDLDSLYSELKKL